jgi:hypothetical protein
MPGGDPTLWRNDAPSLPGAFKNPLNLKMPAGAVFSPGYSPPRRRDMHRPSIPMLNFTYEDDLTIKIKYDAGTSRTIQYIYIYLNHQQASPILRDYPFNQDPIRGIV